MPHLDDREPKRPKEKGDCDILVFDLPGPEKHSRLINM